MRSGVIGPVVAFALTFLHAGAQEGRLQTRISPERISAMEFSESQETPFLGVFTHVEPIVDMPEKVESLRAVLAANPHISGITMKLQWKQFHPEKDRVEWERLEELIAIASSAGKLVNLALIPGAGTPEWVYEEGAQKAGPVQFGRQNTHVPLPWDPKFMALYLNDVKEIAKRYGDDPRLFQVEVLGHNYNSSGEEMHAPSVESMLPYGWTREKVLENWRFWIDQYNALFPKKKLSLVISQMYRGGNASDLPRLVTQYFVEQCKGRAVLQTHQLGGRTDFVTESGAICREFSGLAPNCHEAVMSFSETPDRQGSAEMTLFNARQRGDNLLYLQLWRRDCNDPKYAKALLDAWGKYGSLDLDEMKARMIADGVYVPPESGARGSLPGGAASRPASRPAGGRRGGATTEPASRFARGPETGLLYYAKTHWADDPAAARNPYIIGALFQIYWSDIEKENGVYDWSVMDRQIKPWFDANKVVALRIFWTSNGHWPDPRNKTPTPQWVWKEGATPFIHSASGTEIPLQWDPIYVKFAFRFLEEMARKFDSNPNILFFDITPGGETSPYRFSLNRRYPDLKKQFAAQKTSDGQQYSDDLWLKTCMAYIEHSQKVFKRIPLVVTLNDGGLTQINFGALGDFCVARGIWLGQNGLSGRMHSSESDRWTLLKGWRPKTKFAYEMVASAGGSTGTLMEVMQAAARIGVSYVNVYPDDVLQATKGQPDYDPAIEEALKWGAENIAIEKIKALDAASGQ